MMRMRLRLPRGLRESRRATVRSHDISYGAYVGVQQGRRVAGWVRWRAQSVTVLGELTRPPAIKGAVEGRTGSAPSTVLQVRTGLTAAPSNRFCWARPWTRRLGQVDNDAVVRRARAVAHLPLARCEMQRGVAVAVLLIERRVVIKQEITTRSAPLAAATAAIVRPLICPLSNVASTCPLLKWSQLFTLSVSLFSAASLTSSGSTRILVAAAVEAAAAEVDGFSFGDFPPFLALLAAALFAHVRLLHACAPLHTTACG